LIFFPTDFFDATAISSDTGKFLSSNTLSIVWPTSPRAPMMAVLYPISYPLVLLSRAKNTIFTVYYPSYNLLVMKRILVFFITLPLFASAQFTDDFTDGNFTSNPIWLGDTGEFEVDGLNQLHLNDTIAGESYLYTNSGSINNATWEFFLQMDFNPSSSNYARAYLISDQTDLSGALNGYFVKLGNTADEVSLYKQSGTTQTEIIDGADGSLSTSVVTVSVKVTRDSLGNWELFSDTTGGVSYVSEGTVLDATHISSAFFGVRYGI